jgi:hypothetical protein
MPVFRINIVFAGRKGYRGYHIVDGIELDNYYRHLYRHTQKAAVPLVTFDVVQISEYTRVAVYMRANKLTRLEHHTAPSYPRPQTGRRRRRL